MNAGERLLLAIERRTEESAALQSARALWPTLVLPAVAGVAAIIAMLSADAPLLAVAVAFLLLAMAVANSWLAIRYRALWRQAMDGWRQTLRARERENEGE